MLVAATLRADAQLNLIYIMTDDLGYGDLGCFGQQQIQTPHLDRLAAAGMKLTSYYAGCTVCRPSRLSLWTGRHMGHTAIDSNAKYVFQPADVTVGQCLQEVGYVTGGVGKWAMGGPQTTGHPNKNGFDFWMGYLDQSEAHNYYPTHLWRNDERYPLAGNVIGDFPNGRGRVASKRVTYSHDVMTEQMLGFIRRNHDKPFLMHVHWTIPHANNEAGRVLNDGMEVPDYGIYQDKDWPAVEKGQAAMITRMDADVGRLLDKLTEFGIDDETLVLFTSDNGPHREGGQDLERFRPSGPLRGIKRDLYEGGIRVPTIVSWPGTIRAGRESDHLSAFWDWLPTLCDLASIESDAVPAGDGISLVPTLLDKPGQPKHDSLYWEFHEQGGKQAIRVGDWKAIRLNVRDDSAGPLELYNLADDPHEKDNVAAAHLNLVDELAAKMAASRTESELFHFGSETYRP